MGMFGLCFIFHLTFFIPFLMCTIIYVYFLHKINALTDVHFVQLIYDVQYAWFDRISVVEIYFFDIPSSFDSHSVYISWVFCFFENDFINFLLFSSEYL